ncbi:unnamed protein product [Sympodiomycopsis kandeliae]
MPEAAAPNLTVLTGSIPKYFQEAQHSVANHRKNAVALHRIHTQCAQVTEETPKGTRLLGEKHFNTSFLDCLNRVLPIKKGVTQADRTLKFVATYAAYTQAQFRQLHTEEQDEEEEEEDTTATRFVNAMIKHALKGFPAKNKNVRLRSCQVIALLIHGVEAIDDDMYQVLLSALLLRTRDKEAAVRVQAIVALAKLQSADDDEAVDQDQDGDETMTQAQGDDSSNIRKRLLDILRTDPSPEARRAALFNIQVTPTTLPFLMERLRDTDTINRRCVYLGTLNTGVMTTGQLSAEQSHQVMKIGLGEREESVKKACTKLIGIWADKDENDAFRLVNRFDGLSNPDTTMSALAAAFEHKSQLVENITTLDDEGFWGNLTPNSVLVLRSLIDHLKSKGHAGETKLEEIMPVVMALAFRIENIWNNLLETIQSIDDEQSNEEEVRSIAIAQASILDSLLHIALNSDYGDEIGRRKMFTMIREIISHPDLPHQLIEPCIDVLLKLSAGQRDFVRIVVEIVQDLADDDDEEDEDEEMQSETDEAEVESLIQGDESPVKKKGSSEEDVLRAERKADSDSRRLLLVRAMLERMASNLHENTAIHGLIPQLIAPAVRSKDASIREQGLFCLGLCCLLDSKLALDTLPLFLDQIQNAIGDVKLRATQVVFDCLLVHGIPYLTSRQAQSINQGKEGEMIAHHQIVNFLLGLLEDDEEKIQSIASQGISKLMLSGMIGNESGSEESNQEALRSLILVYMSPETISNQEMKQCLNYFLPIYLYSNSHNQQKLKHLFLAILQILTEVYQEEQQQSESSMIPPLQIGLQLLDWCDPTKCINLSSSRDEWIHFDLAVQFLQQLLVIYSDEQQEEEEEDEEEEDEEERLSLNRQFEKKLLVQLLNKLNLPLQTEQSSLVMSDTRGQILFLLITKLKSVPLFEDTATKNGFKKFESSCAKRYPSFLEYARREDQEERSEEMEKLDQFFIQLGLDTAIDRDLLPTSVTTTTTTRRKVSTTSTKRSVSGTSSVTSSSAPKVASRSSARKPSQTIVEEDIGDDTVRQIASDDEEEDLASTLGDLTTDEDDDF